MNSYKAGDKVKLIITHYLCHDWALGRTGVVKQKIISFGKQSYVIEIGKRSIFVDSHDLRLEAQIDNSETVDT